MSWAAEVQTGTDPKFYGNALRFETKEEAETYVFDLMCRWTAVRDTRVVESTDPVTHKIVDNTVKRIDS